MPPKRSITFLVFVLTAAFYIYTLSPSLTWGDGVRLQSEVISGESFILSEMTGEEFSPDPFPFSKVGVTAWDHPLYIVLGHTLVKAFPFLDSLWLVNFISAVFGAASVTLVFRLSYQFNSSLLASVYASLSLAVSHTFWWHSSTPEVYTLFAFLLLLSLYFFDRFERTGKYSALTLSAFFLGLAATDHILAVLVPPALILYFLLSRGYQRLQFRDWKKLLPSLMALVIGFSLFIVQFIRMTLSFPLDEIMGPVIGSTFLSGLGAFSLILLAESAVTYLLFLLVQFGPLGIALGMYGIRGVFQDADVPARKTVALYIVFTLFGIFYRVTDQFAFFLMSHIFFALLMGMGLARIFSTLRAKARIALTSILFLTILLAPPFYRVIPRLANSNGIDDSVLRIPRIGIGLRDGLAYYIDPNKRGDYNAYDFGNETISNLAPDSLVIAEWYTDTDEYFILRYFHKIMGVRPDATILGFPTDDPFSFDSQLVLRVIEDSFPERPVYLASLSDKFYASSKLVEMFCVVPEDNLYRLYPAAENGLACLDGNSVTE